MLKMTILVAVAAAFASVPARAQVDVHAARESLRTIDAGVSSHVQAAGLMGGLAPHLADSADVLIPGAVPLHGRDAALQGLAASPFAASRMTWTPIRVDVSADGHSGYTYGGGTMTAADGTATPARYIAFWRGRSGDWVIEAFMFSVGGDPLTPPPAGFFPADAAPLPAGAQVDASAALAAIMQADRDFAALSMAQNPGAAFQSFAAPDAALGGAYGPEAIGALFAGGGGTLEWSPVAGGMAQSADLGYTVGTAVRRGEDGRVGYTKYLTVWRLQPNGAWKWVVDGGNQRPADVPGR